MKSKQQRSSTIDVDLQKGAIFKALVAVVRAHQSAVQSHLVFWRKPDSVRATKFIAKGALVLVPMMPMMNITVKDTPTKSALSFGKFEDDGPEFFGMPCGKPQCKKDDITAFPDDITVAAYWWVDDTYETAIANMEHSSFEKYGVKIPVLRNRCDILPHVRLLKLRRSAQTVVKAVAKEKAPAKKARTE